MIRWFTVLFFLLAGAVFAQAMDCHGCDSNSEETPSRMSEIGETYLPAVGKDCSSDSGIFAHASCRENVPCRSCCGCCFQNSEGQSPAVHQQGSERWKPVLRETRQGDLPWMNHPRVPSVSLLPLSLSERTTCAVHRAQIQVRLL